MFCGEGLEGFYSQQIGAILCFSYFRQPVDPVIAAGCALQTLGVAAVFVKVWRLSFFSW